MSSGLESLLKKLRRASTKEQALREAYRAITTRFHGKRFVTLWDALKYSGKDQQQLWASPGHLDCVNQNKLLEFLLVQSGKFSNSDIQRQWTLYWGISPHQYLKVNVGSHMVNVDAWSSFYGIKLGDYGRFFHTKTSEEEYEDI